MGGRLDATNCIMPLISVITSIGLDHTQFLGTTLEAIAGEKAGIIKPHVPVIIGERKDETETVFHSIATQKDAPIYFNNDLDYPTWFENLSFPFNTGFQLENVKTAYLTLNELAKNEKVLLNTSIFSKAIKYLSINTGYQKRLEIVSTKPRIILDVSHNFEGIQATLSLVKNCSKNKLHIIYGSSSDKNYDEIIQLFAHEKAIYFTPFSSDRSLKMNELEVLKNKFIESNVFVCENVNEAITQSLKILNSTETLLIFGSFYCNSSSLKLNFYPLSYLLSDF
jgi:dihydrofolate synthase/folylpolyglutamate synthase